MADRNRGRIRPMQTHGLHNSPTYYSWLSMRARCGNPRATGYKNYGGRGITVCDRWTSFDNFLADMGIRPPDLTLDRVDNNGNYEKANCQWASRKEQQRNRRVSAHHI